MAGRRKPTPVEVFEMAIKDADHLVALVEGFTNQRSYRMRKELRQQVGEALKVPKAERDALDCLESEDVFLVFKPRSRLSRDDFADARPLLRQALVAACAAFETYLADKAMAHIGQLLRSKATLTPRLRQLPMTLGDLMEIQAGYERMGWGIRLHIVEPAIREMSSTAPNRVGEVLALIGVRDWAKKVDKQRKVDPGTTVVDLERITDRRNRIAHEADRVGRSRAKLSVDEVHHEIHTLKSIVEAIHSVLPDIAG
jgi:hypothetical protein